MALPPILHRLATIRRAAGRFERRVPWALRRSAFL
jgi:hypothetical protein